MARGRVIAVIDVGSNSVRLLVARELSPVAFEVVDEQRYDARLGQGQADGNLAPEGIGRGLAALRIMAQVAASHGPSLTLAVGTEALRRAGNSAEFIDEVRRQTGVEVQVLSSEEEAFASFLGVVNSTQLDAGHVLDIGGGSLELMAVQGRRLETVQSAPLGAIYSTERYFKGDPPTNKEVRALRKAVRQQLAAGGATIALYGVGGAIRNIARIMRLRRKYPLRRIHGLTVTRREVKRLTGDLLKVNSEARRRLPGVASARADILPAAAVVIDETMELLSAPNLTVAGQGLREGLVWKVIRGEQPVLPNVRTASISGLALANGVDIAATEPLVSTASSLFDATRTLHGYGPEELDLLVGACRLAGIGMHVDYYNRDRHAEYLVHSGDLHGFSHREIVLLGALARWAYGGTPDLSPYRSIVADDDGQRAATLAALLGVARAIHRRSPSPIREAEFSTDEKHVHVRLAANGSIDVEVYELERQRQRVESALKASLVVEAAGLDLWQG